MKVLFNCNNTVFQHPGGGEILLLKTMEYLKKEGITIKLFDHWNDKIVDYDILHNFGKSSNCYDLIRLSKMHNLPIVLTPLYNWPSVKYGIREHYSFPQKIKGVGYTLLKRHFSFVSKSKKILSLSDMITPDSMIEGRLLQKDFGISLRKVFPVPCGVDEKFYGAKPDEFYDKYKLENFILYVGRIDPRKNLLDLIKIMNKINIPLVLIGAKNQEYLTYYENCLKIANKNIHFIDHMDHDSSMLKSAYASAKVLALPSWLEAPGLVALEAGLAGTNIVITNRGTTTEYFKDYAWYVNPLDKRDIESKIRDAYNTERNKELSKHIKENFIWPKVIAKLKEGYRKVLISS